LFLSLLASEIQQNRLSENIKKLAKPNAAKDIVKEIERILNIVN
jgi:UDP-N-acetylglucosamine--N-acetylmuramyl-(pentapeptide) pyrophosphoryl-undecaprenol N-acetylglucosamine transferase